MDAACTAQHIDLLVLPETNLILSHRLSKPLRPNRIAGARLQLELFSPDGRAIETKSGIPVGGRRLPPAARDGALFVLSSYHCSAAPLAAQDAPVADGAAPGDDAGSNPAPGCGETSLLDNFSATTHWEDFEDFAPPIRSDDGRERFVIDRKRITTGRSCRR